MKKEKNPTNMMRRSYQQKLLININNKYVYCFNNAPFYYLSEILVLGRLEKVNLSNKYSQVKILGTLLCVLGALTMSIMQSISAPATVKNDTVELTPPPSAFTFDIQKIIGCLYLVVAVFILSSNVVLQVTF